MRNQINALGVKIVGGEPLAVSTQFIESIVNASQFSVLDDAQSVILQQHLGFFFCAPISNG